MNNKKISIIIPVRNAEKYIERCIESVISQTYTDLDILLVLNNSSDQSESICKKFELKDSRIRVLIIQEAGVSKARNLGIKSAIGKYITFIDADDFIHRDFVKRLYATAIKHAADIVATGFEKYNEEALGSERTDKSRNYLISASDYAQAMLLGKDGCDGYIWGKLYRTRVLSKNMFNEELRFSEDTDLLLRILRTDVRVFISPFVGYFYSQDTSGITKDPSGNDRLKSLELSEKFINSAADNKIREAAQCYHWRNCYYILSQSSISLHDQNILWHIAKKYRMTVITHELSPLKYRLIALLSLFGKSIFLKMLSKRRGDK